MSTLVATELLKVRTTRSWWGMLLGLALWAAVWTLPGAFTTGVEVAPGQTFLGSDDDATIRTLYTTALTSFGYVFTLVLGILLISGEYRHQTVTPTFLATPRRPQVVLAKWVVSALYSLLYGVVALVVSIGVATTILTLRGQDLNLDAVDLPRSLLLALVGFVAWGLIGIGLGTLLGNQVVAILVGIGFVFVEFVATIALTFVSWGPDVLKWLPSNATSAMLAISTEQPDGTSIDILPWWLGLVVLLGYALVSAGLGARLTLARDVT